MNPGVLTLVAAAITAFALCMYVVLDGFDLGVGALLLFPTDEAIRDRMVEAIEPTWDVNETWLILAGVSLFGAFPVAYSVLLPAFYLPIILMLMALGCRGVSMEFRFQTDTWRRFWDKAFGVGSIIAALSQGLILGGAIQGIAVTGHQFSGHVLDFLAPFPLLLALTTLLGYVCLGAAWLYLKGLSELQCFAAITLKVAAVLFAVSAVMSFAGATAVQPQILEVWARLGSGLVLLAIVFFGLLCTAVVRIGRNGDAWPFVYVSLAMLVLLVGLAVTVYPTIVPFRISLSDASSESISQRFIVIGACVVIPVILGYTILSYRVFKGKAQSWSA
jgi:cytochrome bd ubiquinol oxidase subunit II